MLNGNKLTLDSINRLADALRALPPEPIGQWMKEQGMPPDQWYLVLPESMRGSSPTVWPNYVVFSAVLEKPMFVARNQGVPLLWSIPPI